MRGRPANRLSIRCMRVRVMPSRISAMQVRDALERGLDGDVARRVAQPAGKLVAGEHGVGDAAHHPVEQVDGKADRADRLLRFGLGGDRRLRLASAGAASGQSAAISCSSSSLADGFAGLERLDELADPVDHGEHGVDQRAVGDALARADLGQRALGGMAQLLEPRQVEEAAIALHGVDEAENLVEPLAVVRRGLPRDDRAGQGLRHVAGFGDEVVEQLVHVGASLWEALVKKPFTAGGQLLEFAVPLDITD